MNPTLAVAQTVPAAQASASGAAVASAQPPSDNTIVITGSTQQRRITEAPYAIGVVSAEDLRNAGPQVNLSEVMSRMPGIVVANRHNMAQDQQLSSRGFGARAGFGVRGVRLYTDGIPASGPDGQGQISHFDLQHAQRIEVLRGPFSVLYGNSSGGVIATQSGPVRDRRVDLGLDAGSFGLRQLRVSVATPLSDTPGRGFDVRVGGSWMQSDGFRPQSEGEKKAGHARLGWQGGDDRVTVLVNSLDQPADDPLGLTQAQFQADPRQTAAQATQFDTRKTLQQHQVGMQWTHRFDAVGVLRESSLTAYAGERSVTQWLAIAAATQANARHGGGVIDFDRRYEGVDARLTWRLGDASLATGVAFDRQNDQRRGHLNYTGTQAAPVYGGVGTLRREENNRAQSSDAYAQVDLPLTPTLNASAGVRTGRVTLSARDQYLSNGDDSGTRQFGYTNPVAGLRWEAAPRLNLHASVARGFESPTLGELAYRTDGTGGFNGDLNAQSSRQWELGAKWRSDDASLAVDAALFQVHVANEISVATNAGGRQSFRNVGRTRRQGAELGMTWALSPAWRVATAVTLLDATYQEGFLACSGIPCTTPSTPVAAGNRIAGTQRGLAFAELVWLPVRRTELALEARAGSALTANDTNTEAAPRYQVLALRARHRIDLGQGFTLDALFRLDNLSNRAFVGSVIVNDANARFYEPAAPRQALLSLKVSKAF